MQTGITIKESKYSGKCEACQGPIKVGDPIDWYPQEKITYHFPCRPRHIPKLEQDGYFFIDLETSGLDEEIHTITQLGVIFTDNFFRLQSYFSSYVKPFKGAQFTDEAMEKTGITPQSLMEIDPPDQLAVAQLIVAELRARPRRRFAGYNCPFDKKFFEAMLMRLGIEITDLYLWPALDLYPISKAKLDMPDYNYKLVSVQAHHGISDKGAHDAFVDIANTVLVARPLCLTGEQA